MQASPLLGGAQFDCHPEQAFFAQCKDLGEPRDAACPEQAKRAEGFFATQQSRVWLASISN